jgi:hypothetical protein
MTALRRGAGGMKPKRPPGGWPHEQPGHDYDGPQLRAWLGGYEPVIAAEMCRNKGRGGSSQTSTNTRAIESGDYGPGTVIAHHLRAQQERGG